MLEKIEGCILGLAVGDALGYPTEFMTLPAILDRYGPKGIKGFEKSKKHPPGTFTDDTQMTIAVAEALIEAGHGNLHELMTIMGQNFVEWADSEDNNRAPGNTCLAGCENLKSGIKWRDSGIKESKGCGSAMRVAPIGLFYRTIEETIEKATSSSYITHAHPTGVAAAAGAAVAVKILFDGGISPEGLLDELIAATGYLDEDYKNKMLQVKDVLKSDPVYAMQELGEAWVGEEAVACALYCFLKSPGDYALTVLTGANTNGDSDSIACIAGGLSGTYNGISRIPKRWVNHVEKTDDLFGLATRLFYASITNETFKQYMAQNHPKTWPNSYFWKQVQNDWNNALECAAKLKELTPESIRELKLPVAKRKSKNKPKKFEHVPVDPDAFFSKIQP